MWAVYEKQNLKKSVEEMAQMIGAFNTPQSVQNFRPSSLNLSLHESYNDSHFFFSAYLFSRFLQLN